LEDNATKSQNQHFSLVPKSADRGVCENPYARVTFSQSTTMEVAKPSERKLTLEARVVKSTMHKTIENVGANAKWTFRAQTPPIEEKMSKSDFSAEVPKGVPRV